MTPVVERQVAQAQAAKRQCGGPLRADSVPGRQRLSGRVPQRLQPLGSLRAPARYVEVGQPG